MPKGPAAKESLKQSDKILLVLLFWEGDKGQAYKLARLLADLEPGHSEQADFLFVSRFDCKHDGNTVDYVSRKFDVHTYASRRQATGWPSGCNGVFFGAMEWLYHKSSHNQIPRYKAAFVMGPDCAPLNPRWLYELHDAWDALNKKRKICMAGALIPGDYPHINGDSVLLSCDLPFLKWLAIQAGASNNNAGWDWAFAPEFKKRGWSDIPWINSLWNTPNIDEETFLRLRDGGVKWLHGVKNNSALEYARKHLI